RDLSAGVPFVASRCSSEKARPAAPPVCRCLGLAVGDQVTHDVYGLGRVIGIEDGIAALVDFSSTQMRILSPYAKMTKL
ncbi:hypothetical protein ACWEQU_23875, partial [Streptomyces nodosus]